MVAAKNKNVAQNRSRYVIKIAHGLSNVAGWCAAGFIMLAVLITCEMIFVRFVLNHSTIWQTEMIVYLMVAATLLGLPYVQKLRGHVNVDLMPIMLPQKARQTLAIITLVIAIGIIAIMFFFGAEFWYEAWKKNWKSDTVWGVRLWIPYSALPIGFALYLTQLIADLIAVITKTEKPFGIEDNQ